MMRLLTTEVCKQKQGVYSDGQHGHAACGWQAAASVQGHDASAYTPQPRQDVAQDTGVSANNLLFGYDSSGGLCGASC